MNDSQTSLEPQARQSSLVNPGHDDWPGRSEQLRQQEWAMAQKLLAAAGALLDRLRFQSVAEASYSDVTRLLDLASRLGRLATGLQTDSTEVTGPGGGPISIEVEVALRKIYGQPLPGEVIDCDVVTPPPAAINPPVL